MNLKAKLNLLEILIPDFNVTEYICCFNLFCDVGGTYSQKLFYVPTVNKVLIIKWNVFVKSNSTAEVSEIFRNLKNMLV